MARSVSAAFLIILVTYADVRGTLIFAAAMCLAAAVSSASRSDTPHNLPMMWAKTGRTCSPPDDTQ